MTLLHGETMVDFMYAKPSQLACICTRDAGKIRKLFDADSVLVSEAVAWSAFKETTYPVTPTSSRITWQASQVYVVLNKCKRREQKKRRGKRERKQTLAGRDPF